MDDSSEMNSEDADKSEESCNNFSYYTNGSDGSDDGASTPEMQNTSDRDQTSQVPVSVYSPTLIIEPVIYKDRTFHVVRDDYLVGGSKQRGMVPLLENSESKEFVYAGPNNGYAQIALAYAAQLTGKKCTLFVAKTRREQESKTQKNNKCHRCGHINNLDDFICQSCCRVLGSVMVECPRCGQFNHEKGNNCTQCGLPLQEKHIDCPACRYVNAFHEIYCQNCTHILGKTAICPVCSISIVANVLYCSSCGNKI